MFRAALFIFAGIISWLTTRWLIKAPSGLSALDRPTSRSSHTQPKSRLGGLGIVASFVVTLPLLWIMMLPAATNWLLAAKLAVALLSYALIALVGLIDDFRRLGAGSKYAGQLAAALIAVWGGAVFIQLDLPLHGTIRTGWWVGALLAVIWLTGFSNFFNFMDGIDGMAGGVGVIYSLAFAIVSFGTGHRVLGAGSLILAGACLGFLAHNFPPARIFMGDVGSLFTGYVLAAFALWTTNSGASPAPFISILLIFSTFIYDATFTLLRRLFNGERVFEAHRSHLYQRLVIAGQSHLRVSLTYYALSFVLATGGVGYAFTGDRIRILILIISAILLAGFTAYVYLYEAAARSRRIFSGKAAAEVAKLMEG